jgi:hypothetical protein
VPNARPRILVLLLFVLIASPWAHAQITNVDDTTSTPTSGVGHDYIHLLSETVNPASGSVSLRIEVPMPKGRTISIPFSFNYDSNSVHHLVPGNVPQYGSIGWGSNTDALAQGGWSNSFPTLRSDQWDNPVAVVTGINEGNPIYAFYDCLTPLLNHYLNFRPSSKSALLTLPLRSVYLRSTIPYSLPSPISLLILRVLSSPIQGECSCP